MVRQITETAEIPRRGVVVLDFFATWCGPCKTFAPTFERLASDYPTIQFFKVDIDRAPEMAEEFQIRSVPTIIIFRDGKLFGQMGNDGTKLVRLLSSLVA